MVDGTGAGVKHGNVAGLPDLETERERLPRVPALATTLRGLAA